LPEIDTNWRGIIFLLATKVIQIFMFLYIFLYHF
jgi:hypothetical protein